ncbi:MAG: general secretion pathway protein GspK [Candidatus Omnitrophica bacterium]|nr:general secretion pathway protein GspK [Candidatus Omnitrophota bacterium]
MKCEIMNKGLVKEKGSILILAMWVLLFLSVLSVAAGSVTRQAALALKKIEEKQKLYDGAYSGAMLAIDMVASYYKTEGKTGKFLLNFRWINDEVSFKEKKLGDCKINIQYDGINDISGEKKTFYGIRDEESKINLNFAPKSLLMGLFVEVAGMPAPDAEVLAINVIDWRDSDNTYGEGSSGGGMDEKIYYEKAGLKYYPRNAQFRTVEELLLVAGMNKKIFNSVKDYVTVHSSGKININTASKKVLLALGLSDAVASKIVVYRYGPDLMLGTGDDNVYTGKDNIITTISSFSGLEENDKEKLTELIFRNILDVESTFFRVESVAKVDFSGFQTKIICVFDKRGKVGYWGCCNIPGQK